MRIDGQPAGIFGIFCVVCGELIGVTLGCHQMGNRLAVVATGQGCASLARATRDDKRDARVVRARPENSFAEARDSSDGDSAGVNGGVSLQVVHEAADAPGPGGNGAPLIRGGRSLARCERELAREVDIRLAFNVSLDRVVKDASVAKTV